MIEKFSGNRRWRIQRSMRLDNSTLQQLRYARLFGVSMPPARILPEVTPDPNAPVLPKPRFPIAQIIMDRANTWALRQKTTNQGQYEQLKNEAARVLKQSGQAA